MDVLSTNALHKDPTADQSMPLYTISIAAKLTDTTVHTLRVYETKGLIIPHRTSTGRRLYSDTDITRLRGIRRHIDQQGLNLAGIRSLMAMIPCWVLKPCGPEDWVECGAYESSTDPCWQASDKSSACRDEDCRLCSVYHIPDRTSDAKSLYKELLGATGSGERVKKNA
ncbi:MAG: MerR family transcriptional regulator [Fidelibacterota bacterium]|nr:MAG: MerR family transcriptional regulator [Candidatus Neomarinimicrobiota bacterium]